MENGDFTAHQEIARLSEVRESFDRGQRFAWRIIGGSALFGAGVMLINGETGLAIVSATAGGMLFSAASIEARH